MTAPMIPELQSEADFPLWKTDYERDVVYVRRFPGCGGLPTSSYFALKLETYLRMRHIPHEVIEARAYGPRNMIPWIEFNGRVVSDSSRIIALLEDAFPPSPDQYPSAALIENGKAVPYTVEMKQPVASISSVRAEAAAIRRVVEDSLRWAILWHRWQYEPNLAAAARLYFPESIAALPGGGQDHEAVLAFARSHPGRQARLTSLYYQGMGRMSEAEVWTCGSLDLAYLEGCLARAKGPYFCGQTAPTWVDATVFGTLENLLNFPIDSPLKQAALACPRLVAFCARIRSDIWQDYSG